jgi:predicted amidohydrolase
VHTLRAVMAKLAVAVAQFVPANGNTTANLARIRELAGEAAASGASIVVFGECQTTGYAAPAEMAALCVRQQTNLLDSSPCFSAVSCLVGIFVSLCGSD